MKYSVIIILLILTGCKTSQKIPVWKPYDESAEIAQSAKHASQKMQYKLIQSKILDKNELWKIIAAQLKGFAEKDYERLKPLILERDIPAMQAAVKSGELSYEKLTQWYLYRILKFENDSASFLNNIIAINPDAVAMARERDKNKSSADHPIYGIPILLKDNVSVGGMATTAGANAFVNNQARNAFITERLLDKGAIILGKTNLSEWANFLCLNCPNGYSAVGGQTLNPYGRKILETGGSSSGSGSAIAANYAAAAIGTETSGSILSPSSANSIVGLKPTTGLLSRSGIVPISSTFDTPGPMTKTITDNAILLSALLGKDSTDPATDKNPGKPFNPAEINTGSLRGLRFGVFKSLLTDAVFKETMEKITALGATIVEVEPGASKLDSFGTILSADMFTDLPAYIKSYASDNIAYHSVADIVAFNKTDSLISIPYGQGRFESILKTNIGRDDLAQLKRNVHDTGLAFFATPIERNHLDAILSINNYHAGFAAAANYPCLTVPMGYRPNGEPVGLTFITQPFGEEALFKNGICF